MSSIRHKVYYRNIELQVTVFLLIITPFRMGIFMSHGFVDTSGVKRLEVLNGIQARLNRSMRLSSSVLKMDLIESQSDSNDRTYVMDQAKQARVSVSSGGSMCEGYVRKDSNSLYGNRTR